ncbi:MAG: hypothetical protein CBC42_04675 [Betaproteobacteria bacterium TMED82]|nr:MAG: hypothetical protein CBC42_04675 [Betaproteobacteria bacterium TMED82]
MKKFPEFTQLKHRRAGLLMNEKEIKSLVASWFKEDDQKLDKLCEIFGIKDESIDKYKLLSLELARKFLPKKKKVGRNIKWNPFIYALLHTEVLRLKEIDKLVSSTEAACRELSENNPWKEFMADDKRLDSNDVESAETLRKNYYIANKKYSKYCQMTTGAFYYHEYLNARQGWVAKLESILREP